MDSAPLPDGRIKKGIRLHRPDSVHVIAISKPGHILLLREFRPFVGQWIWMLPGGKADKEGDLMEAAQRELQEEAGYRAGSLEFFCRLFYTDTLSFRSHIFIGRDLAPALMPAEADEMMEAHELPLEEAVNNVLSCNPIHAISAAALLRFAREHSWEA